MKKLICVLTFGLFGLTMFTGEYASEANGQTKVVKKKKWSHRKKGAVVGGAAGAATGVLVSKRKVRGAVIGGAAGAGAGYLLGKRKDKKVGNN